MIASHQLFPVPTMPLFPSRRELVQTVMTAVVLPRAIEVMNRALRTRHDPAICHPEYLRLDDVAFAQYSEGVELLGNLQRMLLLNSRKGLLVTIGDTLTKDVATAEYLRSAGFVKITDLIGMNRQHFRSALCCAEEAGRPRQHQLYAISMPDDA